MRMVSDDRAEVHTRKPLEEIEYLESRAKGLQHLLEEVMKSRTSSLVPELPEDIEANGKLSTLAEFYAKEMAMCLGTSAFLGANVMGASTLETLLLMACLRDRSKVCVTKKWQSIQSKTKPKPFLTVLMKMHLTDLLLISEELSWFPKQGIPVNLRSRLAELCGEAVVDKLCTAGNSVLSITEFATAGSAEIRNLLHPGRCTRMSVNPGQSLYSPVELIDYLAMFGCLSTLLALGSFMENQP